MPVIAKGRAAWARLRAGLQAWREDQGGATLVQFVAILPAFVLVIMGSYAMFKVMAARDTLCEATWEATRYLQVEGPHFPKNDPAFDYPDGWVRIASEIMNQELASRTMVGLYPVDDSNIQLWPLDPRTSPESTLNVDRQQLDQNLFYLQVTKPITNPLRFFDLPDAEPGMINLTCRMGGFYEGPPIEPTLLRPPPNTGPGCPRPRQICRPCPGCTPTPQPSEGTPTVCPVCDPR